MSAGLCPREPPPLPVRQAPNPCESNTQPIKKLRDSNHFFDTGCGVWVHVQRHLPDGAGEIKFNHHFKKEVDAIVQAAVDIYNFEADDMEADNFDDFAAANASVSGMKKSSMQSKSPTAMKKSTARHSSTRRTGKR